MGVLAFSSAFLGVGLILSLIENKRLRQVAVRIANANNSNVMQRLVLAEKEHPSPFQKPFTHSYSGMGIKKC